MYELPDSLDFVLPSFKHANLVRDRALPQLIHSEGKINDSGELDGGEVVAVGVDDEADLRGGGWVEGAVLDEVGVYDGVEAGWVRRERGGRGRGTDRK